MKAIGRMPGSRAAVWITMLAIFGTRTGWAGDNVWTSLGPDGGSISALVIDPQNTRTVYAATGNGVFKTTDGGASWSQASYLNERIVQTLLIDPQNSRTLYAGTRNYGVLKSTDAGASWVNSGLGFPRILGLALDPQSPSTMYAVPSSVGVFKSIDGGTTWLGVRSGLI